MSAEMDGVVDDLYEQLTTLKAQRDELLKACKAQLGLISALLAEHQPWTRTQDTVCAQAEAAIAAVEKEGK